MPEETALVQVRLNQVKVILFIFQTHARGNSVGSGKTESICKGFTIYLPKTCPRKPR